MQAWICDVCGKTETENIQHVRMIIDDYEDFDMDVCDDCMKGVRNALAIKDAEKDLTLPE